MKFVWTESDLEGSNTEYFLDEYRTLTEQCTCRKACTFALDQCTDNLTVGIAYYHRRTYVQKHTYLVKTDNRKTCIL